MNMHRKIVTKKRILYFLVLIFLVFFSSTQGLSAQTAMSRFKPAATVNLTKPNIITVGELNERISRVKQQISMLQQRGMPAQQPSTEQILENMIGEVLLIQAAAREGITVSRSDVINVMRAEAGPQGVNLGENELKQMVLQSNPGLSWEQAIEEGRKQLLIMNLVKAKKSDKFQSLSTPSPSEIEKYYRQNRTRFVMPETVKINQVYINTVNLSSSQKSSYRDEMEEWYRKIQNGIRTFEEVLAEFSDKNNERYISEEGYVGYDDRSIQQYFGENFVDKIFDLRLGEVSRVITSNMGYHLVKVNKRLEQEFLDLDDPVKPGVNVTVRQYIQQQMLAAEQNKLLEEALQELIAELKKEAEITIHRDNFS